MRRLLLFLIGFGSLGACDGGLEPPDELGAGSVRAFVTYQTPPDAWPPADSLRDLRFFALPFVPTDTLDLFRDINQLVFSNTLQRYVSADTVLIEGIPARAYVYSGVAQQYSPDLLAWRPVGLVEEGGFIVRPNGVVDVHITVDFHDRPSFPPQIGSPRLTR